MTLTEVYDIHERDNNLFSQGLGRFTVEPHGHTGMLNDNEQG
jgi:hypothetical protein